MSIPSIPSIIAAILFFLLAAAGWYYITHPQKPDYLPNFCELDGTSPTSKTSGYSAPDGTPASPASTAGTTPADAVMSGAAAMSEAAGTPKRIPVGGDDNGPDPKQISRASYYARQEFDGSPFARYIGSGIPLSTEEAARVPGQIVRDSELDGVLGFYRLGLIFLGDDAFKIAEGDRRINGDKGLYVPFCKDAKFKRTSNWKDAYSVFAIAEIGQSSVPNAPNAREWMKAIRQRNPGQDAEFDKLERAAADDVIDLMRDAGLEPDSGADKLDFFLGLHRPPEATPNCHGAETALQAFNLGKAAFAKGNQDEARKCYNVAIDKAPGDLSGPEAGLQAQRALQSMASSCRWNPKSLEAINRDYDARSVDILKVETLQQALRALNDYDGPIDGQLNPAMRSAIRKFQREQGDDETDILSPLQITQLICNAAETEDLASQNALGVMYILGDGVERNIDSAQQWLLKAANRHYPDASYNLAMLYGTGIILDSYRLCDVPRKPEQADRYLAEAADAHGFTPAPGAPPCKGQLMAQKLMALFGPGSKYCCLPPSDRWMLIERQAIDKLRSGPFGGGLQNIGNSCPQPLARVPDQ